MLPSEANACAHQQSEINVLMFHTNCSLDFHQVLKRVLNDSKQNPIPIQMSGLMHTRGI